MIKIKSILWKQHENASNNGCLVVNNALISKPDDNFYKIVNQKLLRIYSLSIIDEAMVNNYIKTYNNQCLQLGSSLIKGVAYRSCFVEKDKYGCMDQFLFWGSSFCLKDFVNNVVSSTTAIGKTLDVNELQFVEKYIKRIRIRRIAFCGSMLSICVLILLLLILL